MKKQTTQKPNTTQTILEFFEKTPFALDGMNMSEMIKKLKDIGLKTTPEKLLEVFKKNEYGHYELVVNDYDLITLYPPEEDKIHDKKFRPKAWHCQVIGGA